MASGDATVPQRVKSTNNQWITNHISELEKLTFQLCLDNIKLDKYLSVLKRIYNFRFQSVFVKSCNSDILILFFFSCVNNYEFHILRHLETIVEWNIEY